MRFFYNIDETTFWDTRYASGIPVNEQTLRDYMLQYRESSITDFLMDVSSRISASESEVLETFCDRYLTKEENGVPVDYTDSIGALAYDVFVRQHLDPFRIWVDTLWEIGIHPWLSFRMNDCHCMAQKTDFLKGNWLEAHPEEWIGIGREVRDGYDKNYNYLLPSVRNRMLAYIREQLSRYDVYGIELDFIREPACFPAGKEEEGRAVMTEFFGAVRALTQEIGAKRGRKIQIHALFPNNPVTTWQFGFDVAEIVQKDYIDSLAVSTRWTTINTDQPLEIWKKIVGNRVPLGAVHQLLIHPYPPAKNPFANPFSRHSREMAYGQAASFVSRGADFVYLYNLYDMPVPDDTVHPNSAQYHVMEIVNRIGKTEEIPYWDRRCALTYDDFNAVWQEQSSRLPIIMKNHPDAAFRIPAGCGALGDYDFAAARISTGTFSRAQSAWLNIQTAEPIDPGKLKIYVNRNLAEYVTEDKSEPTVSTGNVYSFAFRADVRTIAVVEILSEIPCRIDYMDILIEGLPRPLEQ